MKDEWGTQRIESILCQLEDLGMPFSQYRYCRSGDRLRVLGSGATANVYEAQKVRGGRKRYAVKVIGFGDARPDPTQFKETTEALRLVQTPMSTFVSVIDSAQLRVWLDEHDRVTHATKVDARTETEECAVRTLLLQFVVMNKETPICTKGRAEGERHLYPQALERIDEREILRLAFDIGGALQNAHGAGAVHRDVKLENIFYSEDRKRYLLGDCGAMVQTEDGLADTGVYTPGYCAPEVYRSRERKSDNTADIYSLGMVLYVILNGMRFPDADGYYKNMERQYSPGYVPPEPMAGSENLVRIVMKMCSYWPQDRYQTMEEVLLDLSTVKTGIGMHYLRGHLSQLLVLGAACGIGGILVGLVSFMDPPEIHGGIWLILFLVMCLAKGILGCWLDKENTFLLIQPILGLYLCFSTGVAWWKFVMLLLVWAFDSVAGVAGGGGLMLLLLCMISSRVDIEQWLQIGDARWLCTALLFASSLLFVNYYTGRYMEREYLGDTKWNRFLKYFYQNLYWGFLALSCYLGYVNYGYIPSGYWKSLGETDWMQWLLALGLVKILRFELVLSLFMLARQIVGVLYMWVSSHWDRERIRGGFRRRHEAVYSCDDHVR